MEPAAAASMESAFRQCTHWKVWRGLFWPLIPALLLLGLPRLLSLHTERYFDHVMLVRAMPELIILLGICGALGLLNTAGRLVMLARTQVLRERHS